MLKMKRPVAILLAIIMLFSIAFLIRSDSVEAAPPRTMALVNSSILNNFVTSVTMWDISQSPPVQIQPGDTTFIGQNYMFEIEFKENPNLQLQYNSGGRLTYQLPAGLVIQNAVDTTPIQIANGAVVGWYTINTAGLVTVWFDNVDQTGAPTSPTGPNYIDLPDVTITLDIYAQLTEDGGGDFNFGGDVVVTIPPPVPPPPKLDVVKQSRYDPTTERIYYMITITALGAPVSDIHIQDAPSISLAPPPPQSPISNPPANTAFYGFRYDLNGDPGYTLPMDVIWSTVGLGDVFSYTFTGLTLAPGNFITVRYYLDIPILIENNPSFLPAPQDSLAYNFYINNQVAVTSTAPPAGDNTTDHVVKTFPISKSGSVNDDGTNYWIDWTITIGPSTTLNGGTATDTLGPDLLFQSGGLGSIHVSIFDDVLGTNLIFGGTAAQLNVAGAFFAIGTGDNTFTFTVPATDVTIPAPGPGAGTFGTITRVVITFATDINAPPDVGEAPIVYNNNIVFNDHGSGGRVPLTPKPVVMSKTTSAICGTPAAGYSVNYTVRVEVPAGLSTQPLYLYDTLGIQPGGAAVTNSPQSMTITAYESDGTTLAPFQPSSNLVTSGNQWYLYFGTTGTTPMWQYTIPIVLVINYRIDIPTATINTLKGNSSAQLSNAVYLINAPSTAPIVLSGTGQNSVGGVNVNDSWPIFKTASPTAGNPALFNYSVLIKGGFSPARPLFATGSNPVFTDSYDSRLEYVPGSFYITAGTSPVQYFAPPASSDVSINTSARTLTANLNTLVRYSAPPSQGGTVIGPVANWFDQKINYTVSYQMKVIDSLLETPLANLQNTANIQVNTNACVYDSSATTAYRPNPLAKTLDAKGSDLVSAQIIINPDGGVVFAPPSGPVPSVVTAKDILENLVVYTDTIKFFTQGKTSSGTWNGNFNLQMPVNFNDDIAWSVNVISPTEIDFVIPNSQPVMITYDALCTIPQGSTGAISNSVSIYGESSGDGNPSYNVSGSEAGAGGSALKLRVFKEDPVNKINLSGVKFDLYITMLSGFDAPYGLTDTLPGGVNGRNFYRLMQGVTTDMLGVALFDDLRITATYDFLFLLVEDPLSLPPGYTEAGPIPGMEGYSFFTVKPTMPASMISAAETALSIPSGSINRISDFITVENNPPEVNPLTLRISKQFFEQDPNTPLQFNKMTNEQIIAALPNLMITVTDPNGGVHPFTLTQLLNDEAVINMSNMFGGVFMIQESGYDRPNFNWRTNPQVPIHPWVWPNPNQEVVIQLSNIYNIPPALLPPGHPGSLFLLKSVNFPAGTTNATIQQNMQNLQNQNARINITGPEGFSDSVPIRDMVQGVTYYFVPEGTYFFTESNAGLPGYTLTTNPQLPLRRIVMPLDTGAVVIQIANTYTIPPPTPSPQTGVRWNLILPVILLSGAAVCFGGAEFYRRWSKKKKIQDE